jgi:hypothetical protein
MTHKDSNVVEGQNEAPGEMTKVKSKALLTA